MRINDIDINLKAIKNRILYFIEKSEDFEEYLRSFFSKSEKPYLDYALAYHLNFEQKEFDYFLTRLYVNFADYEFYDKCNSYDIADKLMYSSLLKEIDFQEEKAIFIETLEKRYGKTTCYVLSILYKQKLINYLNFYPLNIFDEDPDILTFIKNNNHILPLLLVSKSLSKYRRYRNPLKVLKSYLAKRGIYGKGYNVFISKDYSFLVDVFKYENWAMYCFKKNISDKYFKDEDIIFWLSNYTCLITFLEKQKILSKIINSEDDILKFKSFKKHYDGSKNSYFAIDDYYSNAINVEQNIYDINVLHTNVLDWQKGTPLEKILNRRGTLYFQRW